MLGYAAISAVPGKNVIPEEVRCLPDFARHITLGYNFRLPEIAAAVALGELQRLEELIEMRQVHREPVFQNLSAAVEMNPQEYPQYAGRLPDYRKVSCPVSERLQPRMLQLKTNYFDLDEGRCQADLLADTIRYFS